jgi:mRNA interferase RelE/StbE
MNSHTYLVIILRPARKSLERLQPKIRRQIYEKLQQLEGNPRPQDIESLRGGIGYRVDSGEYRILYEIHDEDKRVIVRVIKHRKDVYRNL